MDIKELIMGGFLEMPTKYNNKQRAEYKNLEKQFKHSLSVEQCEIYNRLSDLQSGFHVADLDNLLMYVIGCYRELLSSGVKK